MCLAACWRAVCQPCNRGCTCHMSVPPVSWGSNELSRSVHVITSVELGVGHSMIAKPAAVIGVFCFCFSVSFCRVCLFVFCLLFRYQPRQLSSGFTASIPCHTVALLGCVQNEVLGGVIYFRSLDVSYGLLNVDYSTPHTQTQ
jgi:apolipoprotein N-acyltransferase